jgi:hypothetical protein
MRIPSRQTGLSTFLLALLGAASLYGQDPVALINQPLVPSPVVPGGARFDLGLSDCIVTLLMAGLFQKLDRRPRPRGFLFQLVHGSAHLPLHRLRDEERFLSVISGQYGTLVSVLPRLFAPVVASLGTRRRISKSQWENVSAPATRA